MSSAGPELKVLDAYKILELAEGRIAQYASRDSLYETYERYYRGRQSDSGPSVLASNNQGRPVLRLSEAGGESERSYSSQRLAPIIDDSAAMLGRMPSTRVEPPEQSDQGVARAEKLTKYLISTHELSAMDRQQADAGYHLSGLGDACYLLEADAELRRVTWTVVHPSTAYPAMMWGYRRFDILDLVIHYSLDSYLAKARWGAAVKAAKGGGRVPVTMYVSPYQRTIVAGSEQPQQVAHIEWDLGFCPAVWIFNKHNGQMANSDIAQALVQQDALDFTMSVFLDGIVQATYPYVGVRNGANMSQDPPVVGPGAPPLQLGDNGDIIVKNSGVDLSAITFGMQSLVNDINAAAGTSEVRQEGRMHSSITTGRAVQSIQGPHAMRMEFRLQEVGAAIRRANAMTLEMQEKAPFLGKKEFEIFGRFKGESFRETMSGKDIDGWYRNRVFWEPVMGMNLQQKTAVAYEGMVAKLWDDLRGMEMTGEEDPIGMRQRIAQQLLHEAELQGKLQGLAGGPAQTGASGQEAGPTPPPAPNPTAPAAMQSAAPSPTMIARPPQMGGLGNGLPTGVPQGISRKAVENVLLAVSDKLKGSVYAVGQLASQGQALHVQLAISDFRDQGVVLPEVRALDPQAQVKLLPESKLPKEAVRVA